MEELLSSEQSLDGVHQAPADCAGNTESKIEQNNNTRVLRCALWQFHKQSSAQMSFMRFLKGHGFSRVPPAT